MSNERLFLGSRRLSMPNDPNKIVRRSDNSTARFGEVDSQLCLSPGVIYVPPRPGKERLPLLALPQEINFAEYVPSGNGIGPEHLKEALGHLRTGTRKLIINADPQECWELLSSLSELFKAYDVGHLVVGAEGLETPLGPGALLAAAETWFVPILVNFDDDRLVQTITETISRARVPVALGMHNPGLIHWDGFQVMNI